MKLDDLKQYFYQHKDQFIQDYFTFLKFPSVSSEPQFKESLLKCADWLQNYLIKMNFQVELWPTHGYPTIFASYTKAGPEQPTLLIYNHYDVQPVDPLNLWNSPPFEPTVRDGQVYARGAQDNKGQCFYVLLALKALIENLGSLPINIKLCIEGEEECGSSGLSQILKEKMKELKADYLAIVDLGMESPKKPAITLGTRGILTMDVEVKGTHTDLHSGSHGGIAFNPIHALVKLLAMMRDDTGKVAIPNFYKNVNEMNPNEKAQISLNFDANKYKNDFGAAPSGGEQNYSVLERGWIRPTLEVNGINGGYSGEGFKTVIPAKAIAKVSCRLVPDQDPEKIGHLITDFLKSHEQKGTKVSVFIHRGSGKSVRTHINSKGVKAFAKAYEEVFGVPCDYIFAGGSIPIAPELAEASNSEVIMLGLGLLSDCIHAPNEHFGLDRIEKGFLSMARAIVNLKN
jgi:acetylornithine deacetylase/succinyl-diaminopimelate desuccinylase-like protein